MQRITGIEDVRAGLDALCVADPRLGRVRDLAGDVPLRLTEPGFASLTSIIVSQQVSRASADAIMGRLLTLMDPITPDAVIASDDELFRAAGFSRPKQRTLIAAAEAVRGGLDLIDLCELPAEEAILRLTAVPGIGPWTAEIYLLFAAGHPDVFPARDLALQVSVGHALGLEERPGEQIVAEIAESWAPWRGVASRLFWAYYRHIKGREAAPITQNHKKS
ncbi:DNA-3-methyladenine glycosylase 2 family protein [Pseudaminobacter sp. 19-2017]|uniref:DNA-3-methyladenine glycosylase II n=1 Tax=Pseudaminobacter soli (ex Zhang et al. 2022) TaxID=2831468 RepID=A0A942DYR8_9HYPH|nr:DNA-3-methyladenine glycosylase [Pseudaminobacter soli]MBS3647978.1 DNA-3-methyladenine glycosylase 2 family protein [Pseudaminobacter soli]